MHSSLFLAASQGHGWLYGKAGKEFVTLNAGILHFSVTALEFFGSGRGSAWEASLQDADKLVHGEGVLCCFEGEQEVLADHIPVLFI